MTKPAVPEAFGKFPDTNAEGATTKFAVADAGSGMVTTEACPIAALDIVVSVLPVLATAANTKEPLDAVDGKEDTVPAVADKPALILPGFITFAAAELIVPVALVKCAI